MTDKWVLLKNDVPILIGPAWWIRDFDCLGYVPYTIVSDITVEGRIDGPFEVRPDHENSWDTALLAYVDI